LPSQLTCLWKEAKVARNYRTAVSLHGHTNHSKEGLYFIEQYANRNPLLKAALKTQTWRAQVDSAITADFWTAYWRPPLAPLAAFRLERDQIERVLGLAAMVSLTDHDDIEAPTHLRVLPEAQNIPLSVEWTVPHKDTTLHLGIHNLPAARAETFMGEFADYTKNRREDQLRDILKTLHGMRDVLVVLNHPMWDLAGIGKQRHVHTLHNFVAKLGTFVHAFELGGLRSWEENQSVLEFAEGCDQLVIGGGDRHGTEPSAVVNLTNAENFRDFVYEVREKRRCHVLFMPQYCEPFTLRILGTVLDAIRDYPDFPEGSRRWDERVFHPDKHKVVRPLVTLWDSPPLFIQLFFSMVRLLEAAPVWRALQVALAKPEHQMQFIPARGREAVSSWTKAYGSRSFPTPTMKSTGWRTPAGNLRRSPRGANSPS
jgi:hypothetical protein